MKENHGVASSHLDWLDQFEAEIFEAGKTNAEGILEEKKYNPAWPSIKKDEKSLAFWWFQLSAEEQKRLLKRIKQHNGIATTIQHLKTPASGGDVDNPVFGAALLFSLHDEKSPDVCKDLESYLAVNVRTLVIRQGKIREILQSIFAGRMPEVSDRESLFVIPFLGLIGIGKKEFAEASAELTQKIQRQDIRASIPSIHPVLSYLSGSPRLFHPIHSSREKAAVGESVPEERKDLGAKC